MKNDVFFFKEMIKRNDEGKVMGIDREFGLKVEGKSLKVFEGHAFHTG